MRKMGECLLLSALFVYILGRGAARKKTKTKTLTEQNYPCVYMDSLELRLFLSVVETVHIGLTQPI